MARENTFLEKKKNIASRRHDINLEATLLLTPDLRRVPYANCSICFKRCLSDLKKTERWADMHKYEVD